MLNVEALQLKPPPVTLNVVPGLGPTGVTSAQEVPTRTSSMCKTQSSIAPLEECRSQKELTLPTSVPVEVVMSGVGAAPPNCVGLTQRLITSLFPPETREIS